MNELKNKHIFNLMEKWAPLQLAYDWDNVGLQIGSAQRRVKKIMITLDVLESVVDEAIEKDVDLIIAHHPLLFQPVKQINVSSHKGRTIEKIIKNDITVYASHTNLDIAKDGVNDMLLKQLELTGINNLKNTYQPSMFKIAVFVPHDYTEKVCHAITNAGAGVIGEYSGCTFQTDGTGTFKPSANSNPFIGTRDKQEHVSETKVESVVSEAKLSKVITALKNAHPYEEAAYDVYPLQNNNQEPLGIGRVGHLSEELTFEEFINATKEQLNLDHVRVIGDLTTKVNKVAVLGGSGEKFIFDAIKKGADVLVTGDLTFHLAQEAMELGLCVIDAGHYIEQIMKEAVRKKLQAELDSKQIEIIISMENTNPFRFM